MQFRITGLFLLLCGSIFTTAAQELYVFSEPASVLPARSVNTGLRSQLVTRDNIYGRFSSRIMPYVAAGITRKLTVRTGISISNMHTASMRYESINLYARYRILSADDLHRHFRLAVFADWSATKVPFHYDEITLYGDKSGFQTGLIATQLWHKFALSGSISQLQVLHPSRRDQVIYIPERGYQSFNYSLSGGLLLLPVDYKSYKQTNLNIYLEFIGQTLLDKKTGFIDAAPALQLIFNSTTKFNAGYRFRMQGAAFRMSENSWLISFEHSMLNAWKKK